MRIVDAATRGIKRITHPSWRQGYLEIEYDERLRCLVLRGREQGGRGDWPEKLVEYDWCGDYEEYYAQ